MCSCRVAFLCQQQCSEFCSLSINWASFTFAHCFHVFSSLWQQCSFIMPSHYHMRSLHHSCSSFYSNILTLCIQYLKQVHYLIFRSLWNIRHQTKCFKHTELQILKLHWNYKTSIHPYKWQLIGVWKPIFFKLGTLYFPYYIQFHSPLFYYLFQSEMFLTIFNLMEWIALSSGFLKIPNLANYSTKTLLKLCNFQTTFQNYSQLETMLKTNAENVIIVEIHQGFNLGLVNYSLYWNEKNRITCVRQGL